MTRRFVRRGRHFAPIRAAPYLDCITAKSGGFPLSVSVHDFAAWNYCTVRMAAQQRDLFSFLRKCEQQKTDSEIEKPDTESEKNKQTIKQNKVTVSQKKTSTNLVLVRNQVEKKRVP